MAYSVLGVAIYWTVFGEGLKAEDAHWIRGEFFGTPLRLTQHLLLHRVCFPLFGDNLDAYYVLTLALHVLNAWLVGLLYTALARGLGGPWPRLGGALAGLLLLCYERNNVSYLSAISYQLVVLFLLCGTLGVAHFLGRRRPWVWGLVVVSYGLALLTNVFALGLPLLWVALELAWPADAEGEGGQRSVRSAAARYGLLLIPLGLLLWQHGAFLWGYGGLQAARGEPGQTALQLPLYLATALWTFVTALFGLDLGAPLPTLFGALLLGLGVWGAWQLRQRRVSVPGAILLFVVLWSGLTFLQAAAAQDGLSGTWRYYYNAAGVALAVAWAITALADRAASRLARRRAPVVTVTLAVAVAVVAFNPGLRRSLARPAVGTPDGRSSACAPCRSPTSVAPAPGADLRSVCLARSDFTDGRLAGAKMRCAHLRLAEMDGADLTGADLSFANLFGASLRRARATEARLDSARLSGARLGGAVFARAKLRDADLSGARAARVDLSGADLSRALLSKTDLRRADLSGARLSGATLNEADLRGARLAGAFLDGADLQGALICQGQRASLRGFRGTPSWGPCPK